MLLKLSWVDDSHPAGLSVMAQKSVTHDRLDAHSNRSLKRSSGVTTTLVGVKMSIVRSDFDSFSQQHAAWAGMGACAFT